MTTKYKKSVKGWRIRIAEDGGVSGSEVYHRDDIGPVAAATLPTIGSSKLVSQITGATFNNCICTGAEGEFPEGDDTSETIRYEFTTKKGGGGGWIGSTDRNMRKFNSGVDVVSRKAEGRFRWASDSTVIEDMDISKRVFNSQFTVPAIISSAAYNAYILGTVGVCAGCVNGSSFDGWPIGTVLFEGMTGGTKYDNNGTIQWAFDLNFSLKLIPAITDGGIQSQNSWLYSYRGDLSADGGWDKPVDDVGSATLYATVNLNMLLNYGSAMP